MFHRFMNYGENDMRPTLMITTDFIKKHMPKYRRFEDIIVVQEAAWDEFKRSMPMPVVKEENSPFSIDEDELASILCQSVPKPTCYRLAVDGASVQLILGETGQVNFEENDILYSFDITKDIFSRINFNEMRRMAKLDCSREIVVDMGAGVGHFSLTLLKHAKAKHLYACDMDPSYMEAFKKNLELNKIEKERYTLIEDKGLKQLPFNKAQRVIVNLCPSQVSSCENLLVSQKDPGDWSKIALDLIDKRTGGVLHCHLIKQITQHPGEVSVNSTSPPHVAATISNPVPKSHNQSTSTNSSTHSSIEKLSVPSSDSESDHENENDTENENESENKIVNKEDGVENDSKNEGEYDKEGEDKRKDDNTNGDVNGNVNETEKGLSGSMVLLEKPNEHDSSIGLQASGSGSSLAISHNQLGTNDSAQTSDYGMVDLESWAQAYISNLMEATTPHFSLKLMHIQPVESYAPHFNHVVLDIKIYPKSASKETT